MIDRGTLKTSLVSVELAQKNVQCKIGLLKTIVFFFYHQGYKPPDEGPSEYQTIPLNKIEDFGVHCKQ